MQMFFFGTNQVCWEIRKVCRFLAVLREYVFYNAEWVEVHKISHTFWVKLYCKMSDLSASFRWFSEFLLENLKLKDKHKVLNHLFSGPNCIIFCWDSFKVFQPVQFWNFSALVSHGGRQFYSGPHHKKASYGLDCKVNLFEQTQFVCLFTIIKENYTIFTVKKMSIEIKLKKVLSHLKSIFPNHVYFKRAC